jgi:hypothetical protein
VDRTELTLAIAGALVAAVALGWVLHWMFRGLNTGTRSGRAARDMVQRLHDAEEAQHRAERRLTQVEDDLGARLAQVQGELDAALASLAQAQAQTEAIREAYRAAMVERGGGAAG